MESFIVRIYRQEKPVSEEMVGVVLKAGEDEEQVFGNIFELYSILTNKQNTDSDYPDKVDTSSN